MTMSPQETLFIIRFENGQTRTIAAACAEQAEAAMALLYPDWGPFAGSAQPLALIDHHASEAGELLDPLIAEARKAAAPKAPGKRRGRPRKNTPDAGTGEPIPAGITGTGEAEP